MSEFSRFGASFASVYAGAVVAVTVAPAIVVALLRRGRSRPRQAGNPEFRA